MYTKILFIEQPFMNPCRSVVTANGKNSLSVRIVEGSKILGRHTLTPHYVLLLFTAQELCQLLLQN